MNIKHYIIACLSLLVLASCSEKDDAIVEYADWKNKNDQYFEKAFLAHEYDEALLKYVESQQDEETGEIMKSDISLSLCDGKITMERKGEFANWSLSNSIPPFLLSSFLPISCQDSRQPSCTCTRETTGG